MQARFYSDTALENFVDEALALHDIHVDTNPGNRDVSIQLPSGHLVEELTALVQINGGDVIRRPAE
jgi:hypothetical protein